MRTIPKSVCFHSELHLSTFGYGKGFLMAVILHQKFKITKK